MSGGALSDAMKTDLACRISASLINLATAAGGETDTLASKSALLAPAPLCRSGNESVLRAMLLAEACGAIIIGDRRGQYGRGSG